MSDDTKVKPHHQDGEDESTLPSETPPKRRFVEVKGPKPKSIFDELPDQIDCYVTTIEPKLCKTLLKDLSYFLPLIKVEEKIKMMRSYEGSSKSNGNGILDGCSLNEEGEYLYWKNCVPLGHLRRVRRCVMDEEKPNVEDDTRIHRMIDADEGKGLRSRIEPKPIDNSLNEPPTKRSRKQKKKDKNKDKGSHQKKIDVRLEVLIGAVIEVDQLLTKCSQLSADNTQNDDVNNQGYVIDISANNAKKLQDVVERYSLTLTKKHLPGRPAKSQMELTQWNTSNWWPTLYYMKKSDEFKEQELQLDLIKEEYGSMTRGMTAAFNDLKKYMTHMTSIVKHYANDKKESMMCGAVIVCPVTEKVISTSFDEMNAILQEFCATSGAEQDAVKQLLYENPLNTPTMFAIQGVSRMERKAAVGFGMDNDLFKNHQVRIFLFSLVLNRKDDETKK